MAQSKEYESKMQKSMESLANEYGAIRAGRANPAILDKVRVDYYGVPTKLNQMAAVSVPEAHTIVIQPWDISTIKAIEKALQTSDLDVNPQNDGKLIRLNFPPLTEERRKDLVKGAHKSAEETKVAVRSIRRDAIDKFRAQKKKSEITEDDLKVLEKEMQDLTDKYCKEADNMFTKKEKEIMDI